MTTQLNLLNQVALNFDDVKVFDNFTLKVPKGQITTVVGPSGCGKSSMLNLLAGLLQGSSGSVQTENEKVGYIFQEDRLLPWETVYENVKLVSPHEDKEEIMAILKALELADVADKFPDQLSGGMRQRCAIARGFYYKASLLLMDEPFKSLDYDLKLNLVAYLGKLWEKTGNTIVFVTHDIDEALLLGHQIIVLAARPKGIQSIYTRRSPINDRTISDERHIELHRQIVKHLATKEGIG